MNTEKDNQKDPNNKPKPHIAYFMIAGLIMSLIMNILLSYVASSRKVQIEYGQFIELVESGNVDKVQIEDTQLLISLKPGYDKAAVNSIFDITPANQSEWDRMLEDSRVYYTGTVDNPELAAFLIRNDVGFYKPITQTNYILSFMMSWVLPIIMFTMISRYTSNKLMNSAGGGMGGFMNVGKSNAKLYNVENKTGVTFADVAGQDEAKESLLEIVDFLHNPGKYTKIGAKQPKGALLVGPPGTGKTMLAKAVAGEAAVPFFSLSGSEFVEMFVGVGASRVRDLFVQAGKSAPCIIFIDEIDAIGKSRDNQLGGNDEREQTLNQLLAEMDGFDSSKGIVVLAATNRPETLDKALLRPGRFDRRIIVEKPDLIGREAILKVHAAKVKMGSDINLKQIAFATSGASGADLANMINEAALRAVKLGRETVLQEDIMEAVEVVIAGKEKKDRILSPKEKELVAYHEVGHALASALQKNAQPVQKITIVPRTMGSLGYTMQMPEEERFLLTKDELLAQITVLLAGRAAEEVAFNTKTTGASNDIERATQMARAMVTQYGMSEKFNMMGLESIESKYLNGRSVATCSEATGEEIDREVLSIIDTCHQKATGLLKSNPLALEKISKYLITKETISGDEFMMILREQQKNDEANIKSAVTV